MRNFTESDYAINKKADGIVYRFADQTVVVTLEDYLHENPGKTTADFAALKTLSDEDYYETDRRDYRQTWKNTPLDKLFEEETAILSISSMEDDYIEREEQKDLSAKQKSLAVNAMNTLTDAQRRRYLLYHVHGMTYREIGKAENANHKSVEESILAAEKKIHKFLSNQG